MFSQIEFADCIHDPKVLKDGQVKIVTRTQSRILASFNPLKLVCAVGFQESKYIFKAVRVWFHNFSTNHSANSHYMETVKGHLRNATWNSGGISFESLWNFFDILPFWSGRDEMGKFHYFIAKFKNMSLSNETNLMFKCEKMSRGFFIYWVSLRTTCTKCAQCVQFWCNVIQSSYSKL